MSIRWLVDRLHVSTPDSEIEEDMRKRARRARRKGAKISKKQEGAFVAEALKIHHENQSLYRDVMRGRFNPHRFNPHRFNPHRFNPHRFNPTQAQQILKTAVRPCLTHEEAIAAAHSIERSLSSIGSGAMIRGSHKKGILQLLWWARTAKTPPERIRWLSQAQDMLQQIKTGTRVIGSGKDPRLGHLFGGPVRSNPWFSPPALQYIARFTGNPPRFTGNPPMGYRSNPWFSPPALQYIARFTGNPPGFRSGDRVTWSEEAIDLEIGRPGAVMRVVGPGLHRDDADRTRIEVASGRQRMVNNWELARINTNPPRCQTCNTCNRPLSDQDQRHGYQTCDRCARGHIPAGSRYGQNPPRVDPMPWLEWGTKTKGYGLLDYTGGYTGAPGWDDYASNPRPKSCSRCRVTLGPSTGLQAFEAQSKTGRSYETVCESCLDEDTRDHEFAALERYESHYDPHEDYESWEDVMSMDYYASNPYYKVRGAVEEFGCANCGEPIYSGDRGYEDPDSGNLYCGKACAGQHAEGPLPFGATNPHRNPHEERHNVLCDCGWGHMGMPESQIPSTCPRCGRPIGPEDVGFWTNNPAGVLASSRSRRTGHNPEEPRHNVLCGCGWGRMAVPESQIPHDCPVCGRTLQQETEDFWDNNPGGPELEQCPGCGYEMYLDPESGLCPACEEEPQERPWCVKRRMLKTNPPYFSMGRNPHATGRSRLIDGRRVPVASSGGKFHHLRMEDPGQFLHIRTKELSPRKGISSRMGVRRRKGPDGGRTAVQSYMLSADMYTPGDAVRWIEGQDRGTPKLVDFSTRKATKRRLAVKPKKGKKPKKVKKKRRAANPPKGQRCVAKKNNGQQCKGRKLPGEPTCVFHTKRTQPRRR